MYDFGELICFPGDIKKTLVHKTGLLPNEQKLLFRGKERDDEEQLVTAGVKDNSKVVLLEDPASKEKKLEEITQSGEMSKASEAVAVVSAEVDKLAERVIFTSDFLCCGFVCDLGDSFGLCCLLPLVGFCLGSGCRWRDQGCRERIRGVN